MVVMSVLLVGFVALSQSLVGSMQLNRTNRETGLATDALREMVETLQGVEDFSSIYRLYNDWTGDDPGPGPAPGSGFAVEGLRPQEGDPDGFVGEIEFPTLITLAGLELREDIANPDLGMPRDLDGDGDVDSDNCATTYRILPVIIRLRWAGYNGDRSVEIRTLIADR